MQCHYRIYNFGLLVSFLLADVACSPSTAPISNNDASNHMSTTADFSSQKQRSIRYDPTSTTPLHVAIGASMCTPSPAREKRFCSINVKKLAYDHALILDPSNRTNFVYPDANGTITLPENQAIFLSCPGANNSLKNVPEYHRFSNFSCICNTAFYAENVVYDFNDLTCRSPPAYEIVDRGFYGRENEYRRFEIGFYTAGEEYFLKLIDIHYDRSSTSTMYAKSVVSKWIGGRQKPAKQHRYDQTHCCEQKRYRLDMDTIYSAVTQDRSFAEQLYCHDSQFPSRCFYLSESSAVIFNRGQLSPRSSFVYSACGSATFVYLNTGPQWRPINEGNWARIEEHVNEMAKYLQKDLVVYTGVHDRLKLKDTGDGGRQKMMFLYASSNNDKSIAIPLYFWKLVYEPDSKRGVVYVTLNNPYVDPTTEDYHACEKPMFSKDGALMPRQWKPRNVAKGYSYMCEVPDFMRNNEILFHDFSAAMVADLLYVTRKPGDESLDGKKA